MASSEPVTKAAKTVKSLYQQPRTMVACVHYEFLTLRDLGYHLGWHCITSLFSFFLISVFITPNIKRHACGKYFAAADATPLSMTTTFHCLRHFRLQGGFFYMTPRQ